MDPRDSAADTVGGYYVPTDPMDDLHCESCQ
ncbi:MAG: ribonucleotide-diphosphate reductase subunit beta [Microcella sp.]|nr:ribonucleotide-diphosphate reductase subunit beta [Microcella sp.]MDO8336638.1 ribonucleotide-diphosphate reductase subunit beta [Microcella sp.]